MFLRKNIFILIVLLSFGCDNTEIENNLRVLVTGKVVDGSGNPLNDVNIRVYTRGGSFSSDTAFIGNGYTNSNGDFNITSFFGYNEIFYIEIGLDDSYTTYQYNTNTNEYLPDNLTFNLGTITLSKIANFSYHISQITPGNTLQYSFRYPSTFCEEYFEEDVINDALSNCFNFQISNGTLDNNFTETERDLRSILNSEIEFTYSINNQDPITQFITINEINNVFEFQF